VTAASRLPGLWTAVVTNCAVVGVRVPLHVGFHAAQTRLRILVRGGSLSRASELAYGQGITGLVKIAGPPAGLTRLGDVSLDDLTEREGCAHIAVQWDAIAADGTLFTALLADLLLIPAGEQATTLSLTGTCWPPPAAGPGREVMRSWATAVAGGFLDSVASELAHPAGTARRAP